MPDACACATVTGVNSPTVYMYTVGELTPVTVAQAQASGMQAQAYPDKATLLAAIKDKLASSDDAWHILFKGSRYMMMEQVMDELIR